MEVPSITTFPTPEEIANAENKRNIFPTHPNTIINNKNIKNINNIIKTDTFTHKGWTFTSKKGNMLPSFNMNKWSESLGDRVGLPSVVYSDNIMCIDDIHSKLRLVFNTQDSLKPIVFKERIDNTPGEYKRWVPQVAHAKKWQEAAKNNTEKWTDITEESPVYDWTFSSSYCGTVGKRRASIELNEDELVNVKNEIGEDFSVDNLIRGMQRRTAADSFETEGWNSVECYC
eukprot:GHVR01121942.1.p1 GENE.GHVR01121942.1~~GHVR01121942.1.p1  ORF type:complete len:230 (+),score=53.90 GHVR01121942.1:2-691(+)